MGIYPIHRTFPSDTTRVATWTEEVKEPGLIRRRIVTAGPWEEERTDCFCCSCPDYYSGHDPFCRNHGYAGERPCEKHGMPGSPDENDVMPTSVQVERARQESVRAVGSNDSWSR